ncbi:MAG: RnfABCDGE type electron transport complex subunit G [Candidatus Cloacimonetes bacterium]|nr:RnfABCDGE type electron transport complex subunit G [Candidatus Cloacimonadota bacterium]
MKLYLKLGLILLAFCVVATALLAFVNSATKPKIEELKSKAAEEARSALIPDAVFELKTIAVPEADSIEYYEAKDEKTGELKGYTFTAAKAGYSSNVKTMAALDPDFKIINIQVIEQAETPGLGANCIQESFSAKFKGLAPDELLVDKDGGKIKSLTGATITTRAIANSLRETVQLIQAELSAEAEKEPKP